MLHFKIDATGPIKTFDSIAKRAGDTTGLLKRWGGYFKTKALARADAAEGWPGLSEETRKKLEQTRTSSITVAGEIRKSYGSNLERYLKVQEKKGNPNASMDLAELRRLRAGGRVDRDAKGKKAAAWGGTKAVDRLRRRLAKAEDQRAAGKRARVGGDRRRIEKHRLLGSVARQIVWDVQGVQVVKTMSKVPWSGVHNEGGTAGNGAQIPERSFLRIDASDTVELSKIALQHFTGSRA